MSFYTKTIDDTLAELHTTAKGLTDTEAAHRLKIDGLNQITVKGEPLWRKIIEPFLSVMIGILALAGGLSILHGDTLDAVIIFVIIFVNAVIDWFQRWSTDRILRSLKKRENDKVEVLRDNHPTAVAAERLVRGDILIISEGQKIPADARLIQSDNLHVNESVLTGESLSVRKTVAHLHGAKEVYDQTNMVFSGSFAEVGAGLAVITATGNHTEFGRIATLASDPMSESPLQKKIDALIKWIVVIVLCLAAIAFALELLRGVELTEAIRFVLAFTVSAVPEGLPIAITVVLALGMKRMAAKKALIRSMRAIENIGLTTIIATDKTGTLTQNILRVQNTWSPNFTDKSFALQAAFTLNMTKGKLADPLDAALKHYLEREKVGNAAGELVASMPFDYKFAMSGNVWRLGRRLDIFVKGAPEKILARCDVSEKELAEANEQLHNFAKKGFRVIALAKYISGHPELVSGSTLSNNNLGSEHPEKSEISRGFQNDKTGKFGAGKVTKYSLNQVPTTDLTFLGFVAIADELRPRVDAAIKEAHRAGIKVQMITGDHAETAFHIAKTIDIAGDQTQVYDSRQFAKLSPTQLTEATQNARVFARVVPEAKYKILSELNKTEVTAMTGDGVNDVPALSRAHVGIAMGAGAAIAKDASDVVLLDNNFRSIVAAIREGRIIIDNVRRMLVYLLATNAGEVLVILGSLLAGLPLPVVAVQILWINLATDTFMVIPLGLEPGDKQIMKQPPAKTDAPILSRFLISRVALTSVVMAGVTLATFAVFLRVHGEAEARSAAFLVLIVLQWVNALVMRGEASLFKLFRVRNRVFWLALVGAVLLQLAVMFLPPLRDALHLTVIHADSWMACVGAAVVMMIALETQKLAGRKTESHKK